MPVSHIPLPLRKHWAEKDNRHTNRTSCENSSPERPEHNQEFLSILLPLAVGVVDVPLLSDYARKRKARLSLTMAKVSAISLEDTVSREFYAWQRTA